MDILLAVTLLAILIKCATASTSIMAEFCEVVHKGDMDKAVELHQSIKGHSASCLNYVVATKDQEFIFEFAKQAQIERSVLLASLHRKKKPRRMIDEAFKVFKFNQSDLVEVASKSDLMCSAGRLIDTLGKIEKREDQKKAIRNGVKNLFNLDHTDHTKYTACLDPLLEAFESQESLRHLKDVLSKTAFIRGSMKGIKPVVEYLYDDPAVTPGIYAQGLIVSKKRDMVDTTNFLLKEADQDDLNAVKGGKWYRRCRKNSKRQLMMLFSLPRQVDIDLFNVILKESSMPWRSLRMIQA